MGADLELFYASCHPERSEESLCNTLSLALSYRTDVRYLYILRSLVVALYCDDSTVILNITSVWLVILSEVKDLKKRFFVTLRMTKLSFVIGEFISGWSHEAWMKIMPCGSLRNERANDIANIE